MHGFLEIIGRPELLDDPRFRTVADRFRHVAEWFAPRRTDLTGRTTAEWLPLFEKADVPAAICHTLESLAGDPQLAAVGLLVPEEHPTEGTIASIRPTILEDGRPAPTGTPARALGEDTEPVLLEAGLSRAEVDALFAAGAAIRPPPPS